MKPIEGISESDNYRVEKSPSPEVVQADSKELTESPEPDLKQFGKGERVSYSA